jgi:WD40 repeat protein
VSVFSKGAVRFASGGSDCIVRIFAAPDPDSADQEPFVQLLRGHTGPIVTMEFSPTGDRLLTGAWDGTARIWSYNKKDRVWSSIICKFVSTRNGGFFLQCALSTYDGIYSESTSRGNSTFSDFKFNHYQHCSPQC